MKRKGLILFLAITLTTVFMPAEAMQIYGASAINYNSSDALSYAKIIGMMEKGTVSHL